MMTVHFFRPFVLLMLLLDQAEEKIIKIIITQGGNVSIVCQNHREFVNIKIHLAQLKYRL